MHMSNYLKGVASSTPVTTGVNTSALEETNKKLREELDELEQKYLDLQEKIVNIPDTTTVTTDQEDGGEDTASVATLRATIEGLQAQVNLLKKKLEISNEKHDNSEIKRMLEVIHDQLINGSEYDHDDELTNDEVNEILEYISTIHDKYFKDIPLAEDLSKLFVWNIPRSMYKAMRDSIDKYEADIINPMFFMFIALSEEPGWMIGRFLDIVGVMIVDQNELIEEMSEEYQNQFQTDDEESDQSEATDNNATNDESVSNDETGVPVIESEIIDEGGMFNVSYDIV